METVEEGLGESVGTRPGAGNFFRDGLEAHDLSRLAAGESRHPAQVEQLLGGEARVDEVVGDARGAEEAAVRLLGPKLRTACEILLGRHVG